MASKLRTYQAFWELQAAADPLWAVLSDPTKLGRKWDLASFFETGRREVSLLFHRLQRLGLECGGGAALDFGCGVGRLTQPLAEKFDLVVGLDISPTMLKWARLLNRHGRRVAYLQNATPDLAQVRDESMSFVCSDIVLQHVDPETALAYIGEFARVLRRGGVAVFQLPSHRSLRDSSGSTPLPDEAYRHDLTVIENPADLLPATKHRIQVVVANRSAVDWRQDECGPIRLGNHWLDASGRQMIIQDDGRTALPSPLSAGTAATVTLELEPPREPGRYWCEIDLVHEAIAWFGDRGAIPHRFAVDVVAPEQPARRRSNVPVVQSADVPELPLTDEAFSRQLLVSQSPAPAFPMFGVPTDSVVAVGEERGLALVDREVDDKGGPEWVGYRYIFRKRGSRP